MYFFLSAIIFYIMKLNKKHKIGLSKSFSLLLPLISLSLFGVGFANWAILGDYQPQNFNVDVGTGTVVDISDCIQLNGDITMPKFYSGGFLTETDTSFEKTTTGSIVVPLKFVDTSHNYICRAKVDFVYIGNAFDDVNFTDRNSYGMSCNYLIGDVPNDGKPTSTSPKSVTYIYEFTQPTADFAVRINFNKFDSNLFDFFVDPNSSISFTLTAEIKA